LAIVFRGIFIAWICDYLYGLLLLEMNGRAAARLLSRECDLQLLPFFTRAARNYPIASALQVDYFDFGVPSSESWRILEVAVDTTAYVL
jgi:hypothetical protein